MTTCVLVSLALFGLYFAIDYGYAVYTFALVKRQAARAANISFVMHVVIALGVISYVQNFWYILPIACGSWAGTYTAVRWGPDGKEREN